MWLLALSACALLSKHDADTGGCEAGLFPTLRIGLDPGDAPLEPLEDGDVVALDAERDGGQALRLAVEVTGVAAGADGAPAEILLATYLSNELSASAVDEVTLGCVGPTSQAAGLVAGFDPALYPADELGLQALQGRHFTLAVAVIADDGATVSGEVGLEIGF